jgi:hypothetical protein
MTARRSGATCRCDPASIRANSGLADYRHPAFELPPHERVGFRAGQLHRFTATRCKALRERGNGLPKLITTTLHNIRRRRGRHEQPKPASISNPGIPLPAMVGMSGARLLRRGQAMAIPLIFPVATWGSAANSELNIDTASEQVRVLSLCALVRNFHKPHAGVLHHGRAENLRSAAAARRTDAEAVGSLASSFDNLRHAGLRQAAAGNHLIGRV